MTRTNLIQVDHLVQDKNLYRKACVGHSADKTTLRLGDTQEQGLSLPSYQIVDESGGSKEPLQSIALLMQHTKKCKHRHQMC